MAEPPDADARRAIREDLDTTMLVEAGAGTGKTRSMVERMVEMVATGRCRVENIAAVTFTRKAASELRARFRAALESTAAEADGDRRERLVEAAAQIERCFVGTIHSFCARLLRERPVEAGAEIGFEELDEETDAALRDEAWQAYVADLFARDDPILAELEEVGLEPADLRDAFLRLAEFPDVEEWPAPEVPPPDLHAAVPALRDYARHMRELSPGFPTARGTDRLMYLYERVPPLVEHMDEARPAEVMAILEQFSPHLDITQKMWPEGHGKTESKTYKKFVTEHVEPAMRAWREHRYPIAVRALLPAVETYDRLRREVGALNFQDLLMGAARLLRDNPHVRAYFRSRYRRLLVDEFQDTDPVQAEVMLLLTAENISERDWRRCRPAPGSLFVVGDPKQSIYRFRRADIVTYNAVRDIVAATGGRIVPLSANFRSAKPILDWVNGVFGPAFGEHEPEVSPPYVDLEPGGDEKQGIIETVPAEGEKADEIAANQADLIARRIAAGGTNPGDVMILLWSKSRISEYARALEQYGLPHEVTGGGGGAERETALLTACLRAVDEPDDPVALLAALRSELFGISDADLYGFRRAGGEWTYEKDPPEFLAADQLHEAFVRLRTYAGWFRTQPLLMAVERVCRDLGLPALAAVTRGGDVRAGSLLKAVETLRAQRKELWSLTDVVEALGSREMDGIAARPAGPDAVRLMNLHKAKGLEAPVVILANPSGLRRFEVDCHIDRQGDTTRGYLAIGPRDRSGLRVLAEPQGWADLAGREKAFLEAEHTRLLYVAATRAGRSLLVTRPGKRGDPWDLFHPHLTATVPIDAPPQSEVEVTSVITADEAERAALKRLARWETARGPTYGAETVTERLAPHPPGADGGEDAMKWGSVVHRLLQLAPAGADIRTTARELLEAQDMDPARAEEAAGMVETVMRSDLWTRARNADRVLTEVPLQQLEPPATILRGVIDLAFREPDGWVVVDYKTESPADVAARVEHYRRQLETYARMWGALTGEPARETGVYFTPLDRYVTL